MKAFVTGITGFDGNYLASLLLNQGAEVFGAARSGTFNPFLPALRSAVHYRQADIEDFDDLTDALADSQPDFIFHLAAASSASHSVSEPRQTYRTNHEGTLNLLEAVRVLNLPCRVLAVSSSLVYGRFEEDEPAAEARPLRPETPYAGSKAAAEMAAYQYWRSYGVHIVRVRPFNHTGPGQKTGFLCPDLASRVAEMEAGTRSPMLTVRGSRIRVDFSDVRDIVRGYYRALVAGQPGCVYNLCSGVETSVGAIARLLVARARCSIVIQEESDPAMKAVCGLVGDSALAARELAWRAGIPLQQTLDEVVDDWRLRVRSALARKAAGIPAHQADCPGNAALGTEP